MSPAPVVNETQPDLQLRTLARALEALLLSIQQLGCKERLLQQRLKYAHDEYLKLAHQLPTGPNTRTKIISEKILGHHSEFDSLHNQSLNPLDVVNALAESGNVGKGALAAITEGLECCRSINHPQEDNQLSDLNSCYVATRAGLPGQLEKDFTTKGTHGDLRCPFVKPNNKPLENGEPNGLEEALATQNGDTCGLKDLDPIKAEQSDRRSSLTTSAKSGATHCPVSRCPIRFMDQHSPEEIADYVERHKHEIPRSHAVCVQRYQRDEQTMRLLDSKYGSLINMIRGLSAKHQAFLPGHSQDGAPSSTSSVERVEKWAEGVGMKSPGSETPESAKEEDGDENEEQVDINDEDDRKGRFDRPLREVRVGESPSRPWGIHVPATQPFPSATPSPPPAPVSVSIRLSSDRPSDHPAGVDAVDHIPDHMALPPAGQRTGRCPFGHGAPQVNEPAPDPETETIRDEFHKDEVGDTIRPSHQDDADDQVQNGRATNSSANIVFNGPVFFGFSPEQTAAFLQQLGNLGVHKPTTT
ncbi:uncharacterized protein ACLA_065180 [Aspergillus clavatus NRRL 1]|uniref:Uncharacterized protein n=1 Tax=Aspergillus clavatus (strain ATCC 1007 / CBS 513.65 / DSM 816 / NCTC 3887 / NRRL 1 / QM 1276 / 107) TaxID=344612 RepID=A1CG06_ASPCL|nr:uncharacterized protein ACLA_065180 [Aspergillus clavatus NRRL 1]EAW10886.1 conserved hypothetical protein [Aspergillus clavatus NRRL 1]